MAVIKCKMCGGDLNLVEDSSIAECEYCGSVQTVPKVDDEKKLTLFSRADRLRSSCEFDKAAGVYEAIVADFPQEAEAYWGLILCKYGIEYVDDPSSGKKIPTCHRSGFQSVMDDSDFEQVMENSDVLSRRVYREEAKAIEELRKSILAVSSKEEPYDIFICYKETDFNGQRTLDSVLAQDIYDALTEKQYRVFFSRITLEDKLGQEYEPYIFAALNSAKIMLAIGTNYEYYNAVWVKNEWSRYLKLMEQDKSRHLIPCYSGIDAYDMPKEFARLQGQDLGKLGAIQDLLRGIGKLLPKEAPTAVAQEPIPTTSGVSLSNLLKRAEMALEDEKWSVADEFCEQVLNADAENGEAYLYKFMIAAQLPSRSLIEERPEILFDAEECFKRDVARMQKYAKGSLLQWLNGLELHWKTEAERRQQEDLERFRAEQEAEAERQRQEQEEKLRIAQEEEARRQRQAELAEKRSSFIKLQSRLSAGYHWGFCACVKADGSVLVADKPKSKPYQATNWKNIVAIDADSFQLIGINAEGTVFTAPEKSKVSDWKNMKDVAAGAFELAGLSADGTISVTGYDFTAAKEWKNITSISLGENHLIGLDSDGNVFAVGKNKHGQCDVSTWHNMIAISAGNSFTIGICENGQVLSTGDRFGNRCDVENWTNVVAVSAGVDHTLGLRADGTVYITGQSDSLKKYNLAAVNDWKDMIAVSAGYRCCLGLRADGTVLVAGEIKNGRENIEGVNLFDCLPPEERRTVLQSFVDARNSFLEY